MSEYRSLYLRIRIKEEKLHQFFREKPTASSLDDNWHAWWNSREMYGKQALMGIPVYPETSNRVVFDKLLGGRDYGSVERYDAATQTWTFISVFFSENYVEILPMLALLKSVAAHQDADETGIALIYDFCWGDHDVMACVNFGNRKALLEAFTTATQIEPDALAEANQALEAAVERFNEQFND